MSDVTQILQRISLGDPTAAEHLLPLVYDELRGLAGRRMASERGDHTLQATALVHEAYMRLVGGADTDSHWDSRGHFFAAAAVAMRRILVDHARKRLSQKRGGEFQRVDVDSVNLAIESPPEQLLELDDALTTLAKIDELAARIVQLRYFSGLSIEQAAKILEISSATAYRHWNYARAWLHSELGDDDATQSPSS